MGLDLSFSKIEWNEEPSAREKAYFGVVLLMIAFLFTRLFWGPAYDAIQINKKDIARLDGEIKTRENFIKKSKVTEPAKPVISQDALDVQIEKALRGRSGDPHQIISSVTRDLTSRQKMGGLELKNISFDVAQVESGYLKMPIGLSVMGAFSSLQGYLSKLEKLDYLFVVDNIKLRTVESSPGVINGDLVCSLYISASVNVDTSGLAKTIPVADGPVTLSPVAPTPPAGGGATNGGQTPPTPPQGPAGPDKKGGK